jgi:hypothetical protein
MKIKLTKKGQTRWCQDYELELLKSAGWSEENAPASKVIEPEEVINLKAPKTVKSKGTVEISLDNAIESKGD